MTYRGSVAQVVANGTPLAMAEERDTKACMPLSISAPLGRDEAERLSRMLKAVAAPTRLQLISLIKAAPQGEACVCDLTEPLGLRQPTVSHHLKVLVEAGIFTRDKRGVWAYYALVPAAMHAIATVLSPPR